MKKMCLSVAIFFSSQGNEKVTRTFFSKGVKVSS